MSIQKNPTTGIILDILGPTVEFLTSPDDPKSDFCALKGIMAGGVVVPLHTHVDTEDFIVVSGQLEILRQDENGYEWYVGKPGDFLHIPSYAPHALRNPFTEPATIHMITTKQMGHFFQEIGAPVSGTHRAATPEVLAHFQAVCAKYGYWNATLEENAAIGLHLGF